MSTSRIVVVTNLWPSDRRPAWGSFVANRVDALRRLGRTVDVVGLADRAWAPARYASLTGATVRALAGPRPAAVVEAHIAYPTGLFALPVAARLRAPLVLFAHGSDVLRLPDRSGPDRALARRVFGRAALVIANSDYLAGEVSARLGVDPARVAVVPPGIKYDNFVAARQARTNDERADLLFVANLIPRKGLDVLLDALAELDRRGEPVPRLTVIGDGPERVRLTQRARTAGLPVDFRGARPQEEVATAMVAARIVVVPSREEALGLAALEGMAAGCVTVVAGVGGLAEVTVDGVNGLVCRPEDPVDLARAINRAEAITADAAAWEKVARAGDETARDHDVDAMAARTIELYDRLGVRMGEG